MTYDLVIRAERALLDGAERPATVGKGRIALGADADLVAFADCTGFTVTPESIRHRHPVTPYLGQSLTGVVRRVWLGGQGWDPDTRAGRLLVAPG